MNRLIQKKVIVIGAGILGASTAYQLSKMGADVTIIDREDQGQATDAAAGIICPWLSQRRNQSWYRLAKGGAGFYPELIAELEALGETNTGYGRVGALSLHRDHNKIIKMEQRALQRREDAPEIGEIAVLESAQVQERLPLLEDDYEAVYVSGAARVDGRALRDALLRSANHYGAEQVKGNAVLQYTDQQVTGVHAAGELYTADEVIVCSGAWAAAIFEPLGLPFNMHYQKGQIMHLHMEGEEDTGSWPVVMPPTDQYLLGFDNRHIVIGATHENDVTGYDTSITAGGMQEVLNKGLELAPSLAQAVLQEVRVGFRPFTADFLPVFGKIPGWQGLWTGNGLGASGLTMGPYIGRQLALLALDQEPDIEITDYDVSKVIQL